MCEILMDLKNEPKGGSVGIKMTKEGLTVFYQLIIFLVPNRHTHTHRVECKLARFTQQQWLLRKSIAMCST